MKLLICTQKVDKEDDVLGFFHSWLDEIAKHYQSVVVICLERGRYILPKNVKVLSLGKEEFNRFTPYVNRPIKKLLYLLRFYRYLWQIRNDYNKVLVHMNPEYLVLGGLSWRIKKRKIALWYTHKQVNLKLRIAEKLANTVFTASEESFCLPSKKLKIVGHGIDINYFQPDINKKPNEIFKIIYVGRLSKIKNQLLLLKAINILNQAGVKNILVKLIGGAKRKYDKEYLLLLNKFVKENKLEQFVEFPGGIPYKNIVYQYREADLSINLCPTGGMDKVVLESMACQVPAIVLNKTFKPDFKEYCEQLILEKEDPEELAEKINNFIKMDINGRQQIGRRLRQQVVDNYSLDKTISKIINEL
ncbi:MAG: glycosyltransferase family 4 protein [Patescibacteria group bacterium]